MANENTPPEVLDAIEIVALEPDTGETPMLPHAGETPAPRELTGRQKLWLVGLVVMKRVRFVAILAGVGFFIVNWDGIKGRWDRWTHHVAAAGRELPPGQEFSCKMDPQVVRTTYEPNGDVPKCPICGMPLTIHEKGKKEDLPAGIAGRAWLSPERIQMAGIKTVAVDNRPVVRQTKTVGYVTYDESRLSRIVSRVDGYVEKLYVDKNYAMVKKGAPLAEIYSPDLYSTARELVLSAKGQGVNELVASARNKLLLLGVSAEDIDRMAASGEPSPGVMIRSPLSGQVVEKKIVLGAAVEARMTLFELADLSTVWIEAEVYEKDIAFLQPGQKVEATLEAYPNRTFAGELAAIYPRVEAATRTNRIRVRLPNPDNELRPGMFAAVTIDTPLESIEPYKTLAAKTRETCATGSEAKPQAQFLVVPEEAVVDTGAKKIVYVERQGGLFEGVEVELGPRQDDFYPVLKGLAAGDQVVAAGGFLVDAETRLNPGAASTYFGATGGTQTVGVPAGHYVPLVGGNDRLKPGLQLSAEDITNIEQLPPEDRQAAKAQAICPVSGSALGSMGVPVKITLRGKAVYVCCQDCVGKAKLDPDGTLKKLESKRPHPACPDGE
jgi:Cu(I)/Ag(I) efflux system membrane fusion protein